MYLPENREQSTLLASVISGRDSKELLTKDSFLELNAKIKKIYHPKFEKCFKVTPEHSDSSYLKVEFKSDINGVKVFQKVYSGGNFIRDNSHPNLINEVDYSIEHIRKLCFDEWFIYKFYEFPYTDLRTLYKKRINVNNPSPILSTADLNILLKEQSRALAFLHNKGKFHGSLKPSDIAITKKGRSKLWTTSSVDSSKKFIHKQKNLLMNKGKLYQSPLVFDNLMSKNTIFKVNPSKEDSFALGLILLEAGTGLSCQSLYKGTKTFNHHQFEQMIKRFEYSHKSDPELVKKIKSLCEIDSNTRQEVSLLSFKKVSQPVEPNTNNNSLFDDKSDDVGFFNSDKNVETKKTVKNDDLFFNSDDSWNNKKYYYSPGQSTQKFQNSNNSKRRNYTPTRTTNALGQYHGSNNYSFKNQQRTNHQDSQNFFKKKPDSRKYIENNYEPQPQYNRPVSPGGYGYNVTTSKSLPKKISFQNESRGFNSSLKSNKFQTFGQMTSIQEMNRLNNNPKMTKKQFNITDQYTNNVNLYKNTNVKIYRGYGSREDSLRFKQNENLRLQSDQLFNNPKYNSQPKINSNTKFEYIKNNVYNTDNRPKSPKRYIIQTKPIPKDTTNIQYQSPINDKPKRYRSANILNNRTNTQFKDYKFSKIKYTKPIKEVPSHNTSQNVSVSKTSSSNVDTFPVMQIGQANAQSPIAMDRELSLKPQLRTFGLNKNTLLSQMPAPSPKRTPNLKNIPVEQYDIDAEEFLAKQKELKNYNSDANSKFNLLSHNFEENYNLNKDLVSQDNSFQMDGNHFANGTPRDFDENFKINADELFSQRLYNSNEMIGKQFNFEEDKDPFKHRFDKMTDNSGSQDSYMKIKSKH